MKYLVGIEVVKDCSAIGLKLAKQDLVPRIGRWWLSIQEEERTFEVEYWPCQKMIHVAAFSRNLISNEHEVTVQVVNINHEDWILSAQMLDDRCT